MLQFALKAALVSQMDTTNPASHVRDGFISCINGNTSNRSCAVSFPGHPVHWEKINGTVFTIPVPVILHIFLMFEKSTHILHNFGVQKRL